MYNRYIPQSDGSYRKNRVPDQQPEPPRQSRNQSAPAVPAPEPYAPPEQRSSIPSRSRSGSVTGFLRNLLPKEFDTGDLLIVLLLLLMAEQCEDDQNTALLTLALYFFM